MEIKNLRAYLANVGLTVGDLAEMVGYNRSHLSRVASGVHKPGPKLAKKIKEVTNGEIDLEPARHDKESYAIKRKKRIKDFMDRVESAPNKNIKIS